MKGDLKHDNVKENQPEPVGERADHDVNIVAERAASSPDH